MTVITMAVIAFLFIATLFVKNKLHHERIRTKEFGYSQAYSMLDQLATEVQLNYFVKLLGDPIFVNYSSDRKNIEYIFVTSSYFVQAITNSDDKVLEYAVTSRDKDFNPTFKNQAIPQFRVTLGISHYQDLINSGYQPDQCYGFLGNTAPSFYFEQYPADNTTDYQTYFVGFNDTGYSDGGTEIPTEKATKSDCVGVSQQFRTNAVVNTYAVLSRAVNGVEALNIDFRDRYIGPNRVQMRLLENY